MTTRPESASPRSSAGPSPRLSSLGESLARVGERFSAFGALGLVAVDAQPLAEIERDYGHEAYLRALGSLASLVENLAKDRLSGDELLVTGETGHHELVVLLFRSPSDGEFYRSEMPLFVESLAEALVRHGHRVVYPYCRKAPIFGIGYTGRLRNPHYGVATQVRSALEDARGHTPARRAPRVAPAPQADLRLVIERQIYSVYEPIVRGRLAHGVRLRGARARARTAPSCTRRRSCSRSPPSTT